jgi:hypothetical protein
MDLANVCFAFLAGASFILTVLGTAEERRFLPVDTCITIVFILLAVGIL